MRTAEFLSFSGAADEDITLFLQQVKQEAFIRDRSQDIQWILDFTETALSGVSLRWFSTNVHLFDSWHTLRQAFLSRFEDPANKEASRPLTAIPTPLVVTPPSAPAKADRESYRTRAVSQEAITFLSGLILIIFLSRRD